MTSETRTLYSTNDEEFWLDDVDEVMQELDDADALTEGSTYYVGEFSRFNPADCIDAASVLEQASERLVDECGDCVEDAFSVGKNAVDELDEILRCWVNRHVTGQYWAADGMSRELRITANDIQSFRRQEPTP